MIAVSILEAINKVNNVNVEENMNRLALINSIMKYLQNRAMREGLLALEEAVEYKYNSLMINLDTLDMESLKRAILLVVDGTDSEPVEKIMQHSNYANSNTEIDLVISYIIMRGLLLIQAGTNPRIVEEELVALIAFKNREVYDDYYAHYTQSIKTS